MKFTFIYIFISLLLLSSCTFDTSGLNDNLCGNGKVEPGEKCEQGIDLSSNCEDLGYRGGVLSCTDTCQYDTSQCGGLCGECQIGNKTCFGNKVYKCIANYENCGL